MHVACPRKAMQLSNATHRDGATQAGADRKGPHSVRFQKRLSQREQRLEEFLRKLEVKLRRADRTLL